MKIIELTAEQNYSYKEFILKGLEAHSDANENAIRLYTAFGFEIFSLEKRAIKLKDTYLDENAMVLFMKHSK